MGIKERRTKLLLALFLLSNVDFSFIKLDETVQKVFDLSFNQKTKGTLSGMIKEGLIEKSQIPDSRLQTNFNEQIPSYKLTEKGFSALCLEFPFFRFLRTSWDGHWRVISYEIPEKKRELRDRLRREMEGWGLGPWHRSFWLTPHPIIDDLKELVSGREEEKYVQAFESEHVFGDREELIEKVWSKSNLDKQYRQLFKLWHEVLSQEGDKSDKFSKVITAYVTVLRVDPGLPKDLLGDKWIGFEAFNILKEIKSILLA